MFYNFYSLKCDVMSWIREQKDAVGANIWVSLYLGYVKFWGVYYGCESSAVALYKCEVKGVELYWTWIGKIIAVVC